MKFDINKYLERIGFQTDVFKADLPTLKKLHYHHLLNVPFENLDIHLGRKIILDTDLLYNKIVNNNRGGFCYELNGLFYFLLSELGYNVKMISARVYNAENIAGPEFDHMALIVKIGDKEYLCDVGFGCNTAEPLEFKLNILQKDPTGNFIIEKYDDVYFILKKYLNNAYQNLYLFTEKKRKLNEFNEMCSYHQTSPGSHFTKNKVCSMFTQTGMKTVSANKTVITVNGIKQETPVRSKEEFRTMLKVHFDISI